MTTETTNPTQAEPSTPTSSAARKSAFIAKWSNPSEPTAPAAEPSMPAPAEATPVAPVDTDEDAERKKRLADADTKLRARQEEAARRRAAEQAAQQEQQFRQAMLQRNEPPPPTLDEADPIGSIRRMGKDPKVIADKLLREAHAPGISAVAEEVAAVRKLADDATKQAAAAREELARRDREAEIKARRQSITDRLGTPEYPLSSKLDSAKRQQLAVDEWQRFATAEIEAGREPEYDEELIALRVEDTLAELTRPIRGAKTTSETKPKASVPKPPISTSAAAEPSVTHTPRNSREFRAHFLKKHGASV